MAHDLLQIPLLLLHSVRERNLALYSTDALQTLDRQPDVRVQITRVEIPVTLEIPFYSAQTVAHLREIKHPSLYDFQVCPNSSNYIRQRVIVVVKPVFV